MLRVIVCCVNGMGTSQMIKMKVEKVFSKLGIKNNVLHASIGEAKKIASNYDVVFCPLPYAKEFETALAKGTKIIGVKNLLSEKELEEKIREHILNEPVH